MAALGEDGDFAGKLRLPLPDNFSGQPADWEEWSWNFKAYISMFEAGAVTLLDNAEALTTEFTDAHLEVTLDTGDVDVDATRSRVLFSRKLHYLLSQLVKDSAKLVVRQNVGSNGFETWRRLFNKFALPDATRSTALLTQLLDFRFGPNTFEQDFNVWETIKVKYEKQAGQALPDGVLVATLLNKTTGALQQHLRLNAKTLQTYEQVREVILEYYRSRLLVNPLAQTSASATFAGGGQAPMDIGYLGKGKGKKGKGKGKGKGKKGKGKDFGPMKGKGKGKKGPHWNFFGSLKGKSKGKGKNFGSSAGASASSSALCWTCGKSGHFASKCPLNRVNAVEGEESELYGLQEEESYFGEAPWDDWSEWTVGALFDESWESWDDSLWDSSWDSWDWYSYQDFAGWNEWWPEATSSKETLSPQQPQKPKEESTLQHGAQQAPVSAVTMTAPPGLSKAAPKPKAKSSLSPSSFLMSALVLGNFGVGQSFGFEGMLTGDVDFSYGEKRATFSSVGMAPLETFSLNRNDSVPQKLFSVYDLGVSNLNTTFRDHALEEHLVAATFDENEPWILFDSGAATHCCPQDFASEWPLLPLSGKPPPLRSISGQPLTVYGRRLVKLDFDGQPCFLHFYVCDVPYCVVSVGRLLRQGFQVTMTRESQVLSTPDGSQVPIVRQGSLLFLRPTLGAFNKDEFVEVCNLLHDSNEHGTLIAPTQFNPVYYNADRWELSGNTLTRIHKRSRATFFSPEGTKDRPVELESLADERVTYLTYEDGRKETLHDNWRTSKDPKGKSSGRFVGRTVFKLSSKSTGRRLAGKQSTFPQPVPKALAQPQDTLAEKPRPPKDHSAEDTFRLRLAQAASGTLPDFQKALVEQLSEKDPATGEAFTHDRWLNFQLFWVRVHYVSRNTLYVPEDPHFEEELGNARMTLIMRPDAEPTWHFDLWRKYGTQEVTQDFVGATCFEKLPLEAFEAEPAQPEYLAQRPKGLKQPGEPTLTERLEHELTHLPFKPWCEICLKAKSRQAHSKKLSLRQPVLQMDFSFLSDKPGEEQVTILNVVDVLSNMALSVVIPTKARTPYSHAELRRFVLETGRTFGILQCDPEPALKAIAEAVTGEVGGLSLRSTPTGWKQAQGSVGNMQATLYGQIKALRLELLQRYQVDLSVHSALFTWLVRHAQWLVNRYLCNAAGTTAFERRWGKRYNGFICRFGETVLFRKQRVNKGKPAFERGVWLGKDTESEQHFVADSRGVYKTRSLKRLPPTQQSDVALLQSVTARPWDPTGAKVETDSFIFPMQQSEEATNLALPPSGQLSGPPEKGNDVPNYELSDPELEEALGLDGTEPVPARDDLSDLPEDYFSDVEQEPPLPPPEFEPPRLTLDEQTANAAQARSSTDAALPQPPGSRPRLSDESPASPTKRSTETFDVGTTKVQRINAVTFYSGRKRIPKPLCYLRVAAVTTKNDLEVPVAINQDEKELLLMKTLENPYLWYETEFPLVEEVEGMKKEMKSMTTFDVFEEVHYKDIPQALLDKVISTRWVKVRKSDGTVRCRLVVRGYTQEVNDKDETFASTPSLTTLKLLLTLAVARGWHIAVGDISTAFLHAAVDDDFYVIPPLEFYPDGCTLWKLKKALYGLKHSPKLWQEHFASVMKKNGFRRVKSDPNLYVHETKQLYVLAYVDDLMFFGSKPDVELSVADLQKDLLLKMTGTLDEGQSVTFLGRELQRTNDAILVGMNPAYIDRMLETAGLSGCKPVLAPGTDTLRKQLNVEPLDAEAHKRYRRIVGQLLWLSSVRPDIMYAVKELSRGLSAPTSEHEAKAKHLLKYLAGTKNFSQRLQPTLQLSPQHKAIDINVYVDSDWAGCADSRRSTSGVSLFMLGANILSHSRTQATVALSSGEAELYAIGSGTADALFLKSLIEEAKLFPKANLCIWTDSNVGKSIVSRFGASRKTKHVELRFLYVQELVASGMVRVKKVLGTLNPADILTKYVPKETLHRHLPTFGFPL